MAFVHAESLVSGVQTGTVMPDEDVETPVFHELIQRCDRSNLEEFVRAFEQANDEE